MKPMSLRIFSAGFCALALAGCGGGASPEPEGNTIDCAIGPGAEYSSVCTLERVGEGAEFLIHHPDGGFRRLLETPEGVVSADGADTVVVLQNISHAHLEIEVGGDRYKLPNPPDPRL